VSEKQKAAGDGGDVYAELVLLGPNLEPDAVTTRLGILPTRTIRRGARIIRGIEKTWTRSGWSVSSRNAILSDNLVRHIEWIVELAQSIAEPLRILRTERAVTIARIWCMWEIGANSDLFLKPKLLRRIADLGLTLGLDAWGMYCPCAREDECDYWRQEQTKTLARGPLGEKG
jgi:hypothetical protein